MAEDTKQRLIRYLNDAYAMETGALVALKDIAQRTSTPEVRGTVASLIAIVETQIERLGARITTLGGKINGGKAAFDGLIASGNRFTNAFHDEADKDTQEVMKSYGLSEFEIAVYTSLREYSDAIGDHMTAQLAQSLINEEKDAADRLMSLIPGLARTPAYTTPRPSAGNNYRTAQTPFVSTVAGTALIAGSTALAAWGISQMLAKKNDSTVATNTVVPYVEREEVIAIVTEPDPLLTVTMDVPASGSVGSTYTTSGTTYNSYTTPTVTPSGDVLS